MALFLLSGCLLFCGEGWILTVWASPDIRIPSQYCSVKEAFSAQNTEPDKVPTIIHIQDAHCNYEAQKNTAGILEYLAREHGLKLIMVEGGSGDVCLSFLRGYADEKARVEVADKYLKEGKISGEEYFDIVSGYPLELYGIEDQGLYEAHLASFQRVDAFRETGLKDLAGLSGVAEGLKPFIYNEDLRRFEEQKKKYQEKALSLAEYCQYLKEAAGAKGLRLNDYPQLTSFVEVARLEKGIDFKEAESQRNAFIQELASLLDADGVKGLTEKSREFKAGKIAPQEYYSFLKSSAKEKIELKQHYPQLEGYINYLVVSKDIDTKDLLGEIGSLEERIREASLTNDDERRLAGISKSIEILGKILNLELTPQDYAYFQAHKADFVTAGWIDFLSRNCRRYNLVLQPAGSQIIDENFTQLEEFYQLGVEREKAFMKNIFSKMDASGEKLAVLITGGFHTPGITRLLREKGYAYVVAAPVITQKSDSSIYFSVLRREFSQPEEAQDEE